MNDSSDRAEMTSPSGEIRSRTYLDDDGQAWSVSEQPFSPYDRRHGWSLIFTSDLAVRRVRNYPPNWYELSDPALAILSWNV
jgi:hypothetical protein